MRRLRVRHVALLVVALAPLVLGARCAPEQMVTIEVADQFTGGVWTPLPATGGMLEIQQGMQGALMVVLAARVTGADAATAGRIEYSLTLDGDAETATSEMPLDDLAPGPTEGRFDFGSFTLFSSDDPSLYVGRTATLRAEVVGGGYYGLVEVEVTLVDLVTEF